MTQINALPPPEGFFRGEGFTASLNGAYAEVNPQRGLSLVINAGGGFPVEEVTHHESLMSQVSLPFSILLHDWIGLPCNPVTVWRPFVEAMSDIHTGMVTLNKNTDNEFRRHLHTVYAESDLRTVQDLHTSYGLQVLTDLRTRAAQQSESVADRSQYSEGESKKGSSTTQDPSFTVEKNNYQETIVDKALKFITLYQDQRVFHFDFGQILAADLPPDDKDWFLSKWARTTYPELLGILSSARLLEIYLPLGLSLADNLQTVLSDPEAFYREICAILDRWIATVETGNSPFPVAHLPPADLVRWFAAQISCKLADLLRRILFSTANPTHYLVRSLPAIFFLLHPMLVWIWQPTPLRSYSYPWVVLEKDHPTAGFSEPSQVWGHDRIRTQMERKASACHLYGANLDDWIGPDDYRSVDAYALSIALHIWSFLRRLETLWQNREQECACDHCRLIVQFIAQKEQADTRSLDSLGSLLDNNGFTCHGLDPLLDAATLYPEWLHRETQYTYQNHPALPNPSPR